VAAFTLAACVHLVPKDLPSADFLDAPPRRRGAGRTRVGWSAGAGELEVTSLELDANRAVRSDGEVLDFVEGDSELEDAVG
jgi:hypothetical protein